MSSSTSSNLSSKKIKQSLSDWICDSAILKPIFYNPFIISAIILLIIWSIDILYDKCFSNATHREILQHICTTYIVVASGVAINNIIIEHKHKKELEKHKHGGDATDKNDVISDYIN